jgi:hypothetical protein
MLTPLDWLLAIGIGINKMDLEMKYVHDIGYLYFLHFKIHFLFGTAPIALVDLCDCPRTRIWLAIDCWRIKPEPWHDSIIHNFVPFSCVCVAARISSRENLPKRTLHLGSKNCGSLQDISKVNLWRCVNPFPVRLKTDRPETMVKYTIHQEVVTGIMGMGPSQQDLQPFMVQLLGWKGPHNCWVLGQGMNSNLRLRFHVSLLFLLGADELNFAFGHVWHISGFRGALFVEKNANMYVYIC